MHAVTSIHVLLRRPLKLKNRRRSQPTSESRGRLYLSTGTPRSSEVASPGIRCTHPLFPSGRRADTRGMDRRLSEHLRELPLIPIQDRRTLPDRRAGWRGGRRDTDWTARPLGALERLESAQQPARGWRWFSLSLWSTGNTDRNLHVQHELLPPVLNATPIPSAQVRGHDELSDERSQLDHEVDVNDNRPARPFTRRAAARPAIPRRCRS